MRPLPIEAIAGAPSFVRGVSIIRGVPTPVIDLGILLGTHNDEAPVGMSGRFITLRLGERQAALSVDSICDVLELDAMTTQELPPLLQGASNNFIETITTLDAHMLVILRSGWQLPDAIWRSLATPGPAQISVGEIITNEISERA
jgi:purine-binding chemotaxis protein CheW